jgi:hypothetical protein
MDQVATFNYLHKPHDKPVIIKQTSQRKDKNAITPSLLGSTGAFHFSP